MKVLWPPKALGRPSSVGATRPVSDWAGSLGTGMLKVLLKVGYLFEDNVDSTSSRHLDSEEDIVLSIFVT